MMEEIATQTESAEVLLKLARPFVSEYPHVNLQKSVIERLEHAIATNKMAFDKYILFVGSFELTIIPDASEEAAVADSIKLNNLPSTFEAGNSGLPSHALGTNFNGFAMIDATTATELVHHAMLTMSHAGQLDYLRRSGIVGKEWKILVEIHYYRERSQITHAFHKDTYGQTLFVNLNYDTDHEISGPEYILNPAPVEKHEADIAGSLPAKFLNDLKWVRGRLGEPSKIAMPTIPANGFVAFVDEAIHHMTPHYGGRTVKGSEVGPFLEAEFGIEPVADARAAFREFRWQDSDEIGAILWSVLSSRQSFASFLKVIPKQQADRWFNLIEVAETPEKRFGRGELRNVGLTDDQIDRLFAASPEWKGYQEVDIPNAGKTPLAKPVLKRQASEAALQNALPQEVTGNRRFFRTWVRAVRVPKSL